MSRQDSKRLFILGHPVAHSKSPAMYNALYPKLGLNWDYGFMDCPQEEQAQQFLAARDFFSINITMPYKPLALKAADAAAPSAKLAGGANVLVNCGGLLAAYNTDGRGCAVALQRQGVELVRSRAVVCGTGPTSMAILHALVASGASQVTLLGRTTSRCERLIEEYRTAALAAASEKAKERSGILVPESQLDLAEALAQVSLRAANYEEGARDIREANLIVDATPLGMHPGDPAPFDTSLLDGSQAVFDVVYGHGETALLAAARAAGCQAMDGAGMLVGQAVATAEILLQTVGCESSLTFGEMFDFMYEAAQFS